MLTLAEIKIEVDKLADKIGAPSHIMPNYGFSKDWSRPYIEVDSHGYHLVEEDPGRGSSRATTNDIDTLLHAIFARVIFNLASTYEREHRVENQDHRRLMFQHQIELLSVLSPEWAERESVRQQRILWRDPFDNASDIRANLCKSYKDQGLSDSSAWKMACERYPLPMQGT